VSSALSCRRLVRQVVARSRRQFAALFARFFTDDERNVYRGGGGGGGDATKWG